MAVHFGDFCCSLLSLVFVDDGWFGFFILGGGEEIECDNADHTLDAKCILLHLSFDI